MRDTLLESYIKSVLLGCNYLYLTRIHVETNIFRNYLIQKEIPNSKSISYSKYKICTPHVPQPYYTLFSLKVNTHFTTVYRL